MSRRYPRRNPLLSANRTPTPEMKDYQEYIDPQLWMLANGGDVQAMYEMSVRGPAHWLPARPNPTADAEYQRNIQNSAKTFHRIGMGIPRGRYPQQVEADLIAELEKLARTNAGKKGMGRAAAAHHRGESRTERESADRMEWRARARAAADEANEQLRQEERERELKLTLKRAGFSPQQIVAAVRASRAEWVESRKAKKNPEALPVKTGWVPVGPGILLVWDSRNSSFYPAYVLLQKRGQMLYPGGRPGYWQETKFAEVHYQSAAQDALHAALLARQTPRVYLITAVGGHKEMELEELERCTQNDITSTTHLEDFRSRFPDTRVW